MQADSIEKATPNLIRPHLYELWMQKATATNGTVYLICSHVFLKDGEVEAYEMARVNTPLDVVVFSPEDFHRYAQRNILVQIDFTKYSITKK